MNPDFINGCFTIINPRQVGNLRKKYPVHLFEKKSGFFLIFQPRDQNLSWWALYLIYNSSLHVYYIQHLLWLIKHHPLLIFFPHPEVCWTSKTVGKVFYFKSFLSTELTVEKEKKKSRGSPCSAPLPARERERAALFFFSLKIQPSHSGWFNSVLRAVAFHVTQLLPSL